MKTALWHCSNINMISYHAHTCDSGLLHQCHFPICLTSSMSGFLMTLRMCTAPVASEAENVKMLRDMGKTLIHGEPLLAPASSEGDQVIPSLKYRSTEVPLLRLWVCPDHATNFGNALMVMCSGHRPQTGCAMQYVLNMYDVKLGECRGM